MFIATLCLWAVIAVLCGIISHDPFATRHEKHVTTVNSLSCASVFTLLILVLVSMITAV